MGRGKIGMSHGLAWTTTGSQLIQIKTTVTKGTGTISIDCDVGHDFLESLETVIEYLQEYTNADLSKLNMKVVIPGALDGPSAGLPLLISIHSAITKQAVNQSMAFTGCVLADGSIKAVEEIKTKLSAAQRGNLATVVFPLENLPEIPTLSQKASLAKLFLAPVKHAQEAIQLALP